MCMDVMKNEIMPSSLCAFFFLKVSIVTIAEVEKKKGKYVGPDPFDVVGLV